LPGTLELNFPEARQWFVCAEAEPSDMTNPLVGAMYALETFGVVSDCRRAGRGLPASEIPSSLNYVGYLENLS